MIASTTPYIYNTTLISEPLRPLRLPLTIIAKNNTNTYAVNSILAESGITNLVISVYSKESIGEQQIQNIIECTNVAFNYDRLNKEEVIAALDREAVFIVIKQDNKIISSLIATVATTELIYADESLTDGTVHLGAIASIKKGAGKTLIKVTESLASYGFKKIIFEVFGEEDDFRHNYYSNLGYIPGSYHYIDYHNERVKVTRYSKEI